MPRTPFGDDSIAEPQHAFGHPVHLDVPFVFNTIDAINATDRGPVAHELSRRMCATWANFARTGRPDNAAIPRWPAYTLAERSTMIFNH